jgi:predicted phage-related endonuclease
MGMEEYARIPVELKATSRPETWADGVPPYYTAQVQHQLAVLGELSGVIAVKAFGREVQWAHVERDETYIEGVIVPATKAMWDRVQTLTAPEPKADDRGALLALYPLDNGESVSLHADLCAVDADLQRVKSDLGALERRKGELENHIRAAIGKASEGYLPGGVRYTCKIVTVEPHEVAGHESRVLRRYEPRKGTR